MDFEAVGNDYFCKTKPVRTDKVKHEMIFKKHEFPQKSSELLGRNYEMRATFLRQDVKIAEELAEEKRRKFLEQKRRQLLRENNHELRELEAKLRTAYISKCLKSQITEKEILKRNEILLKKQENDLFKTAIQQEDELMKMELEKEMKKKESLKKDLQDQISLIQLERSKRYEDFLIEKKMLDEIACKIHEEQLEEMRQELEKKAKYRSEIKEFCRIQEAWKQQQKKDMDEEDERLRKYFEERDSYYKDLKEKQRQNLNIREEIANRIGQEIHKTIEEKLKKEEILRELYVAEKEANEEQKLRKQIEEQFRRRIQLRIDLDKHKEEILLRKKHEEEEDKAFYEEQMRIFAERDKIDQMSNEKRRRKLIEHRKELQECLEKRKIRRIEEVNELLRQREQEIQEENTRQKLIEEERISLLREHIEHLLGHLPPGILKESDREFFALPEKKINS